MAAGVAGRDEAFGSSDATTPTTNSYARDCPRRIRVNSSTGRLTAGKTGYQNHPTRLLPGLQLGPR